MAYKPLYINDNGTVREVEEFYINDNGTVREIDDVYLNDNGTVRHVFSRHPYEPGTEIFTMKWGHGGMQLSIPEHTSQNYVGVSWAVLDQTDDDGNYQYADANGNPNHLWSISPFIGFATTYPLVFETNPYYTQGDGRGNTKIRFKLNPGFTVSYYNQDSLGTDSNGDGSNTGGLYELWRGNTVSGLTSLTYGLSKGGSGNNGSLFKVSYVG